MIRWLPTPSRQGLLGRLALLCGALALALLLALAVGAVLVTTRTPPPAIEPSPATLMAVPVDLPEPAPLPMSGEMVRRPLFWASRAPLEEIELVESAPSSGPDPLDEVELLGMFSSGEQLGVIIRAGRERRRLMLGQSLGDWQLAELADDGAVFTRQGNVDSRRRIALEHAVPAEQRSRGESGSSSTDEDAQESPSEEN